MTVVVGYVPTPEGEAALRHGIAEAELRDEHLVVVNSSRGDAPADPRWADEEDLAALERLLAEAGRPHEVLHVTRGKDAAEEILDTASARRASVVVLGLRRRTPLGKLLLGSTAQRVLLEAECPVLGVKRP
jgi:nucleotide-binding universal stress UspA family protein